MTSFAPLKGIQTWYDTTTAALAVTLYFLDSSVTSLSEDYALITDLPGRLSSTGSYDTDAGIDAGSWPLYYDASTRCLELSLPASTGWTSSATYSLTFRWLVVCLPGGTVLTCIDYGAAQTLLAAQLKLYAAESVYIPNSYPVYRWRKV